MFSIQTVVGFVVFVAGVFFILVRLRRWLRTLGKIIFARINLRMIERTRELFKPRKGDIFKCLQETTTQRPLRIVEIGAGVGANFEYLPRHAEVICVEPNEFSKKELFKKAAEYPDLKVTFEIGVAENLSTVATESVDAVVSTHVLCSVADVNQTLREVLRVLKKGGKFIFIEHIEAPNGSRVQFWQHVLNAIWPTLFQGCHLTRLINNSVQNAGFASTDMDVFDVEFKQMKLIFSIARRHCAGVATK